ncbi:radical SAM protein [Acutalibacter sp. 1XD8-33]|uniref:radical SAM protein n=1 Tax=Acutalibacter sp. 1XD8-33 TaxID=2320081 RepID=UPI000EA3FB29|nr:radical SAM protein [Acutalibacter sp. 1XD8-33]RKJ40520.1 radical SAM protein [Acutalibacter sp. 1XD8-33]
MSAFHCRLCPRQCGVLRESEVASCHSGGEIRVARAALHHWEEPPISGHKGSGAVFFSGCPLGCLYCQNREISSGELPGWAVSPEELSGIFFRLADEGAHNINLVTPTHYAHKIRQALLLRKPPVPVVYNTSGYERVEVLKSLEGLVDVYLPDYKYAEASLARDLSGAEDYPETALQAIREMVRQAGPPVYGEDGLMKRGVLIRHLILPGHTKNSIAALERIAREFPGIPVSLMAQYTPWGLAKAPGGIPGYPELSRPITRRELQKVQEALFDLGLDGFVQSRKAMGEEFIPAFS